MPKLFDFGMHCGHPLLVQQYKLSHVSTFAKTKFQMCVGSRKVFVNIYHVFQEFALIYMPNRNAVHPFVRLKCLC